MVFPTLFPPVLGGAGMARVGAAMTAIEVRVANFIFTMRGV